MPLTDSGNTATSLETRRRQGKLAQRRFRERQLNCIKELEGQVRSLQAATNKQNPPDRAAVTSQSGPELNGAEQSFEILMGIFLHAPDAQCKHQKVHDGALMQWLSPDSFGGGKFSPRLTYGILGIPYADLQVAFRPPPADIVPYLSDRTSNFARALYWQTSELAYQTGQALYYLSQQRPLKQVDLQTHVLAASFLAGGMKAVLSRLDFRLEFHRHGGVASGHEGHDQAAFRSLHRKMLVQIQRQKINLREYLDATEVESLLQQRLHTAVPGWQLVSRLKSVAICLGEGPRWRQDVVLNQLALSTGLHAPTQLVS